MNILVLNCGSSSIKAAVVNVATGKRVAEIDIERLGTDSATLQIGAEEKTPVPGRSHEEALAHALPLLIARLDGAEIRGVGHRVAHGGEKFREPTRIDDEVLATIDRLTALAPLHNPANLAGILAARAHLPSIPHVAVFDTAFHATLPNRAKHYAIDTALAAKHGIRRYGFHGTSHAFVAERAAKFLGARTRDLRLVSCHLGNGASVCAIEYGRSVDTSMGMTPLEGLVMGSRCGDIDPGALLSLLKSGALTIDGLDALLNKQSGLVGLTGKNDMRDIEERAAQGDEPSRLAIRVFAHRVLKYIGAYAAVMGGVDAVLFTAGIGENSANLRQHVTKNLSFLGAQLDDERNRDAKLTEEAPVVRISSEVSRTHLLVVATDEEHAIAVEAAAIVRGRDRVGQNTRIPVAVSARHIHLTEASVETLFGKGHKLTPKSDLSQPGQYACEETLDVVGPKRTLKGVRVLGPTRRADQVEVSRTDEFFLGVDAPIRDSGDVKGSPGVTLVGPAGSITIPEGLICARRHIHMAPEDAENFGVADGDVVTVRIDSNGRDLAFGDVLIRVSPKFKLEMHVDTDEANAAELTAGAEGALELTQGSVELVHRSTRNDREESDAPRASARIS